MPTKVIGKYSVTTMQILDETGAVDEKLEPKISKKELLKIYRYMVLGREVDQRMLKLQRQGRLGTLPVCVGQEAVAAVTAAMSEQDWMVGSYRELAGRLYRGEPIMNTMPAYNGWEEGNVIPGHNRTLPLAVILASQIPHAVGIAYASKVRGEEKKSAVVTFFGDGSSSEGDFHEAVNFASVWKAPVVFYCQNNHWAISTPLSKQMNAKSIAQRAIAYDIPGIQIDGNDALAVYKATKEALDRAHKGEGPTLIEALTYRMLMHTTADDPKKYRREEEVQQWAKRDPILRFRLYLEQKGHWNDTAQAKLEEEIKGEIDEAVKQFESEHDFPPDAPFDYTFGTPVADLEAQRAEFLENLKKDAEHA
ncbi:MAG TPA: pyruvate dehydrogenase (acetyl-transferring) E1 component subunit alpha [Bacteroidetes bacterium]|nr:pyruvate dehydrogenase (acetyl-transferring) E1 component subunit alpha [Bacteroidota bacterium]